MRYHIATTGRTAVCKAQTEAACPLGGQHFRTQDEGDYYIELHPEIIVGHLASLQRRGLNPLNEPAMPAELQVGQRAAAQRRAHAVGPEPELEVGRRASELRRRLATATVTHPTATIRELDDVDLAQAEAAIGRYNRAQVSHDPAVFLGELDHATTNLKNLKWFSPSVGDPEIMERQVRQEITRREAALAVLRGELQDELTRTGMRLASRAAHPATPAADRPGLLAQANAVADFRRNWGAQIVAAKNFDEIRGLLVVYELEHGQTAAGAKDLARTVVDRYLG